jgi:hypothetical protein
LRSEPYLANVLATQFVQELCWLTGVEDFYL